MKKESNIDGILVVDKPSGMTSRDIVNEVSYLFKTKRIGHTGTLDPIASGVLVLTIGKCTKLSDYLTSKDKEYIVEFKLGYETDTLDITGMTLKTSSKKVSEKEIITVINSFVGSYEQEVPAYSAVKINGKKLYEYARNGETIELPKRVVNIYSISEISINDDLISFRVKVSKGTYIRSLVRDIGKKLGTYATMVSLRRSKQGLFSLNDACKLEDIKNDNYKLITSQELLSNELIIELDDKKYKEVSNGVQQELDIDNEYVVYTYNTQLIALYKKFDNGIYKMYIKF